MTTAESRISFSKMVLTLDGCVIAAPVKENPCGCLSSPVDYIALRGVVSYGRGRTMGAAATASAAATANDLKKKVPHKFTKDKE